MKNQIYAKFSLAAIATLFIFCAFDSTFAQGSGSFDLLSSNVNQSSLFDAAKFFAASNIQQNNLFAANFKTDNNYPKPDFSDIEKWYEVVKYEYGDIEGGDNSLYFWLRTKSDNRPYFYAYYYDKDVVKSNPWATICEGNCYTNITIGTVLKYHTTTPAETEMEKVVSVKMIRQKNQRTNMQSAAAPPAFSLDARQPEFSDQNLKKN